MSTHDDDRVERVPAGPVALEPDPPQPHIDALLFSRENPSAWVESSLLLDVEEYR